MCRDLADMEVEQGYVMEPLDTRLETAARKLSKAAEEIARLTAAMSIAYDISLCPGPVKVHMPAKKLVDLGSYLDISLAAEMYPNFTYPLRLVANIEGVEFFGLVHANEIEQYREWLSDELVSALEAIEATKKNAC